MMGHNHAATGALVGLMTLPWSPSGFVLGGAAWVVACAGAALLPDFDTRRSKAARMWGPISASIAGLVGLVAGGHRRGTHDLVLAPLVAGGLAWVAALHPSSCTFVLALLIGLSLQALKPAPLVGRVSRAVSLIVSVGAGWWLAAGGIDPWHVGVVVALGVLVHILGDLPTTEGVPMPLLWSVGTRRRLTLGLFEVNGFIERWVLTPALVLAVLTLTVRVMGWW